MLYRMLYLQVIDVNASSFSAWAYRWQCLEAAGLQENFEAEKVFLEKMAKASCKNYQLWNHRRLLAIKMGTEHAMEVNCILLSLSQLTSIIEHHL